MLGLEHFGQLDPIRAAAQADIDDREIEAVGADGVEGFAAGFGFSGHDEIGLRVEELLHATAEKGMIIHQQNAPSSRLLLARSGAGFRRFLHLTLRIHPSRSVSGSCAGCYPISPGAVSG